MRADRMMLAAALLALAGCGRSKADQETIDQLTSQLEEAQGALATVKDKAGDIDAAVDQLKDSVASLDDTDWSQLVPAIKEQSGQIDGKVDELMDALGCAKDKPCD